MFTSSSFRAFMYFVFGISAAPLGLFVAFGFACGIILSSLILPIVIGPICFSVYVTFLAYVVWKFVCAFLELRNSLEASIKRSFRSCMAWLHRNTLRVPFLKSSEISLPEPLDTEDSDQDENCGNVQTSLSDDGQEEATHDDVRQFNVRSVSITA